MNFGAMSNPRPRRSDPHHPPGLDTGINLIDPADVHSPGDSEEIVRRPRQIANELGVRFVQLDVTSDASVSAAAETVGTLDVLINNAGIVGAWPDPGDPSIEEVEAIFATNVIGAVRVFYAFLPLLKRSAHPVVVNVSSGLGSFGSAFRRGSQMTPIAYGSSKAALNMLAVEWAFAHPDVKVNAAAPGYTATDMNGHRGSQTVTEGTDAIVQLATIGPDGPTATFMSREGAVDW